MSRSRAGDEETEGVTLLVRDILIAIAERDGISLDSDADPGTPARNYELAQRLGIGHVFGMMTIAKTAMCKVVDPETHNMCQRERNHDGLHAAWADPDQPPYLTWTRSVEVTHDI